VVVDVVLRVKPGDEVEVTLVLTVAKELDSVVLA